MLAGTVRQLCQPPVLAIAKSPIGVAVGLPSRTWTSPLTPPAAPEATRALNCVAAELEPKFTLSKRSQSPLRDAADVLAAAGVGGGLGDVPDWAW